MVLVVCLAIRKVLTSKKSAPSPVRWNVETVAKTCDVQCVCVSLCGMLLPWKPS